MQPENEEIREVEHPNRGEGFKRNLMLKIAYNGYSFSGWQSQENARTIQGEIRKDLSLVLNETCVLYGASRTDAGVHALGQTANFYTNSDKSCEELLRILNRRLPVEISIREIREVPKSFHSRHSAKGKHYRYRILASQEKPLFEKETVYWYPYGKLNKELMIQAAKQIEGTHDFTSFASNSDCPLENKVRTVWEISLTEENSVLQIDVRGESFLYKMVRCIAGTLLEIGKGKPHDIEKIFMLKNRAFAGRNLPPQGLCLLEVYY